MSFTEDIKQKALELGFDLAGITDTSPIDTEQAELFNNWLKSGCAGRMSYMHNNLQKRINPAKLLQDAKSVICLTLNYKPPKPSPSFRSCHKQTPTVIASDSSAEASAKAEAKQSHLQNKTVPTGKVATYAQYEDYHSFIKKQLRKLADFTGSIAGTSCKFKICVDSAPLAERALAARAGLGFIGKNHILTNPELGPQLLLGEIITDLKLPPDEPIANKCSNCNKCLTACPTGALRTDGRFDANKCISYLTIEYKGRTPSELSEKIGARLFGCDECLLACPYQQNAPVCKNKQFKFYPDRACLNLEEILKMTEHQFKTRFFNSPLARTGLQKLKETAELCLRNISE